jgi:hypothetical protein
VTSCNKSKKTHCECSADTSDVTFAIFDQLPLLFPTIDEVLAEYTVNICPKCCLRGSDFQISFVDVNNQQNTFVFTATSFESIRCESFDTFGLRLVTSGTGRLKSTSRLIQTSQSLRFNLSISQNGNLITLNVQLINDSGQIVLDHGISKTVVGLSRDVVRRC